MVLLVESFIITSENRDVRFLIKILVLIIDEVNEYKIWEGSITEKVEFKLIWDIELFIVYKISRFCVYEFLADKGYRISSFVVYLT